MQEASDAIPIAVAEVVGRNHEAQHAAIDETQSPVIAFIDLKQREHGVGILFAALLKIRFAQQVKTLVGLGRRLEADGFGRHVGGRPVIVGDFVRFKPVATWRVEHFEVQGTPFAHAGIDEGICVAKEIIHGGKEIEHAVVRKQVLLVEGSKVGATNLADESHGVVVSVAIIGNENGRKRHFQRQIGSAPPFAAPRKVGIGLVKTAFDSHNVR